MKIAIVHDYLNQFGGAERVVSALHEIFPDAPIYTSIYDEKKLPEQFKKMDIRTSFMQKLPLVSKFHRPYFFFYPFAFDLFDLSEYDVIVSSSSAWAKGIRKRPEQLHICYCHNPMRFVWRYDDYIKHEPIPALFKKILPFMLKPISYWDVETSKNVDYFVANSKVVAERIKKTYQRQSVIINPPVENELFKPADVVEDYYLLVSRLAPYKRIDIVVEAFNQLGLPLKIVGGGPNKKQLQKMAGPDIEFVGKVSDQQLVELVATAQALIFPGEEDFGIVPLEAMASGRPVIAYRAGGALETMVEGVTGLFFDEQTPQALIKAVHKFQFETFDRQKIRQQAEKFSKKVFAEKIKAFIVKKYEKEVA